MSVDFAILAPVPAEHLESALDVLATKDYVSFGSNKFEIFRTADDLRKNESVPVLIYPSHEDAVVKITYKVTWIAEYIGHLQDTSLKSLDESSGHRPKSTASFPTDNALGWGVFWHVRGLRKLSDDNSHIIATMESYGKGFWRKNGPPRGPEIVRRPPGI
jgi:hypothetical protein